MSWSFARPAISRALQAARACNDPAADRGEDHGRGAAARAEPDAWSGVSLGLPFGGDAAILTSSLIGIVTGVLLGLARIAGETAPLLFTALNNQFWSANIDQPLANVPVVIFQYAMSPYDDGMRSPGPER